jgi:ABC-type glycerol-3-phosphate transport system substrate-binding protein
MKKQLLFLLAAAVMLSLVATNCVAPTPQVIEKVVTQEVEVVVEKEVEKIVEKEVLVEKPKLVVWHHATFIPAVDLLYQQRYADFARENNVEIDLVMDRAPAWPPRWQVAMETGEFADLAVGHKSDLPAQLQNLDLLMDVSDVVGLLDATGSGFDEAALDAFTWDGKTYAVPYRTASDTLYYRQDWLDELGLEPAQTWEELFDLAEQLTVPGERYGLGLDFGCNVNDDLHIPGELLSYGGSAWDENGMPAINSPESIEWLTAWQDAFERGIFPPEVVNWQGRDNNECYFSGNCAVVFNGTSVLRWLQENDPELAEQTTITQIPDGPEGKVFVGPMYSDIVWKGTKYPEQAKALLEYVNDPEWLKPVFEESGLVALRADLRDLETYADPQMAPFAEQAQYNVPVGSPGPLTLWAQENFRVNLECQMLSKVLIDGWTPEEAAEWAQDELQKLYDQYQ